jgi:threonine dehydrogenase-like Zn-dependent dehydrogenase
MRIPFSGRRVFDRVVGLDAVPDGYRAMNEREAIKVMMKP